MLNVAFYLCYAECRYAGCRYVECHYAEWHYVECRYAERRGTLALPIKVKMFAQNKRSSLLKEEEKSFLTSTP